MADSDRKQNGLSCFSIVILLIIVLILAAIVIPDFLKFQAKARCYPLQFEVLWKAIQSGNAREVRRVMESKDLEDRKLTLERGKGPGGESWMHLAVKTNNPEIVRILAEYGIEINSPAGEYGERYYPLHIAVENRSLEMVRQLLDLKADVAVYNGDCLSPLNLAASTGQLEIYQLLLQSLPKLGIHEMASLGRLGELKAALKENPALANQSITQARQKLTPLHCAVAANDYAAVEILLDAGANPDGYNYDWGTQPLDLTIKGDKYLIADLLLARGARDFPEYQGGYLIHRAAEEGDIGIIKVICERGMDINIKMGRRDVTAVSIAHGRGHGDIVRYLREHGAKYNLHIQGKPLPREEYIRMVEQIGISGDVKKAEEFFRTYQIREEDPDSIEPKWRIIPELHQMLPIAAERRHPDLVEFLLRKGINPETKNKDNLTAMQITAINGCHEVSQKLAWYADSLHGNPSALQLAAINGHFKIVEAMFSSYAVANNPCLNPDNGVRAEELARRAGHDQIAEYIRSRCPQNVVPAEQVPDTVNPLPPQIMPIPIPQNPGGSIRREK